MPDAPSTTVSPLRLNLLRCGYLLLVAGLGTVIWPSILDLSTQWSLSRGIVVCMLGALSALSLLGLRHPLRMLPLLFFEITWKSLWLLRVATPLWSAGKLDADTVETAFECATAIVFPLIIPWDHVWRTYVSAPAEPWKARKQALFFEKKKQKTFVYVALSTARADTAKYGCLKQARDSGVKVFCFFF